MCILQLIIRVIVFDVLYIISIHLLKKGNFLFHCRDYLAILTKNTIFT